MNTARAEPPSCERSQLDRGGDVGLDVLLRRLPDVLQVLEVVVALADAGGAAEVVDRDREVARARRSAARAPRRSGTGRARPGGRRRRCAPARRGTRRTRRSSAPSAASSTRSSCETAAPAIAGIGGSESSSKHIAARIVARAARGWHDRAMAATEKLPGEAAVLPLAAHENFPVALALPRPPDARAPDRDLRVRAARRPDRRRGRRATGSRSSTRSRTTSTASSTASRSTRCCGGSQPTVRECGLPREPFLRLIEANRRDQERRRVRDVRRARRLLRPLGEPGRRARPARLRRGDAGADRALRQRLHRPPARRALAGRGRGLPARARSTSRPRISRGSASSRPSSARRTRARRLRELLAFEVARARRLLDDGAPLVGTLRGQARLAVAGYVGGGLANADAIVAAGLRRPRRAAAGGQGAPGRGRARGRSARGRYATAGVRGVPADRARVGLELLHRDAAAPARSGATRSSPSTRSRGGSTTSPTATSPTTRSSRGSRRSAASSARLDEADDLVLAAVADAARRYPIPLDAFGDLVDGAEMDVRGHGVRDVRRARRLLPLRRRLDRPARARRVRVSDRARADAARRRPRRRAPAREHPPRPQRGPARRARRTCRARTSSGSGARCATGGSTGPAELLVAFEAQRGLEWLDARASSSCRCSTAAAPTCVLAMAGKYERLLERIAAEPSLVLAGRPSLAALGEGAACSRRSVARWRDEGVRARGSRSSAAGSRGSRRRSSAPTPARTVTLYEARQRLGGATFSFERNGLWLDNGQHVVLRCCTAYLGFLRRLGVDAPAAAAAAAPRAGAARGPAAGVDLARRRCRRRSTSRRRCCATRRSRRASGVARRPRRARAAAARPGRPRARRARLRRVARARTASRSTRSRRSGT